jgi:gamma-glutamyl:cysteine ligase YbdK (ATP-grasp superfamily)
MALTAFAAYGIELEYAIVDAATLDVRADAAQLLDGLAQSGRSGRDGMGWCHELAAHVVEIRNVSPAPSFAGLARQYQDEIRIANDVLKPHRAQLFPSAMHPWMAPREQTVLWTRSDPEIYEAYHRLFDCRRHGWSNIQSMHINLPFSGDAEFRRLHAAIRLVLPLIPALAASSPIADATRMPQKDHRLAVYATNSDRYPAIAGSIVPEIVRSQEEYQRSVLQPMYDAIAPDDPGGILQYEWLNSRGAIARFDRSAIEIRVADSQECPAMDVAIAQAVAGVTQALYNERWSALPSQEDIRTERLAAILQATARDGEDARIDDPSYLALLGRTGCPARAGDVWRELLDGLPCSQDVAFILERGTLATRLVRATGNDPDRARLRDVYRELCDCLRAGRRFT